jgi:hypothetical protein
MRLIVLALLAATPSNLNVTQLIVIAAQVSVDNGRDI